MKELTFFWVGVKTYSDPSYIFSGVNTLQPPVYAPVFGFETVVFIGRHAMYIINLEGFPIPVIGYKLVCFCRYV